MSNDLVFYMNPMSRARIVHWMLEEVGQPYKTEVFDYGTTMKAPEYLAINPMGKVPALKHREVVITECAAICAYLADAFLATELAPANDDPQKGAYYRRLFFVAGPLEAATTNKALGVDVSEDQQRMAGYGTLSDVLNTIDQQLEGRDFIVGDKFTAADLYLSAHLGWGLQFGTIEKRPNFERYALLHAARPAAKRAKEIDDALMAKNPGPSAGG